MDWYTAVIVIANLTVIVVLASVQVAFFLIKSKQMNELTKKVDCLNKELEHAKRRKKQALLILRERKKAG